MVASNWLIVQEEVVTEQVDDEFKVDHEQSEDDEETLLEQEKEEVVDHEEELRTLNVGFSLKL